MLEPAKWKGKVKVQFMADGASAHVSRSKVSVLFSNSNPADAGAGAAPAVPSPTVLVVDDTDYFRRLARTEVRAGDNVVEIGASFGKTSTFLRAALSSTSNEVGAGDSARRSTCLNLREGTDGCPPPVPPPPFSKERSLVG